MPQNRKENPTKNSDGRLPDLDPPAWAPNNLVEIYEEHRTDINLLPNNIDRSEFISTLLALISNSRMNGVWRSLLSSQTPDIFPNLLFLTAFEALRGPSKEWVGLTPKQRQKKLASIEKRAQKLREQIENTPLQFIEANTLEALGLIVPNIRYLNRDGSDLEIVLAALEAKAAAYKLEPPLLKQTTGEYPRRLLLFLKLNKLLNRYNCENVYENVATIASVVLLGDDSDDAIDIETVRKSITHWERDRAESKSTPT